MTPINAVFTFQKIVEYNYCELFGSTASLPDMYVLVGLPPACSCMIDL